jgi:hypothetical protein
MPTEKQHQIVREPWQGHQVPLEEKDTIHGVRRYVYAVRRDVGDGKGEFYFFHPEIRPTLVGDSRWRGTKTTLPHQHGDTVVDSVESYAATYHANDFCLGVLEGKGK